MSAAPPRPPLSRDDFIAWVRREGEARYHDHHRYHALMHEGKLTRIQLQQWVLNRYYYQTRIPIKDALIVAKSEDPAFRRAWIRRIHDHDGAPDGDGAGAGLALWLALAEAVGLDRAEVASCRRVLPGVRFASVTYASQANRTPGSTPRRARTSSTERPTPVASRSHSASPPSPSRSPS